MSRSPWADQSRRSDIRHLRDGSSHRSLTRTLTHNRNTLSGTHTITENQHKHALKKNHGRGQGRELVPQTDVLSRKLFPNILSFSYFSHIIICMSAWWDDSGVDKTLCSTQLLHLSHAYRLKIAYLAQGHRQWFSPEGEREPDVQLSLRACLRLCSISNCLCERLWPVGGKWYRQQQPFCICLY